MKREMDGRNIMTRQRNEDEVESELSGRYSDSFQ